MVQLRRRARTRSQSELQPPQARAMRHGCPDRRRHLAWYVGGAALRLPYPEVRTCGFMADRSRMAVAAASVFPSPRTRRGRTDSRQPSAEAYSQSRPPLPSSSSRGSGEVSNRRCTRCCRPSPRLIFAPAALASGWSSSSLATSACAAVAVPKAFEPGACNRPKPVAVALRSSASPLPGAWCGDALRVLLKSLHGRKIGRAHV